MNRKRGGANSRLCILANFIYWFGQVGRANVMLFDRNDEEVVSIGRERDSNPR